VLGLVYSTGAASQDVMQILRNKALLRLNAKWPQTKDFSREKSHRRVAQDESPCIGEHCGDWRRETLSCSVIENRLIRKASQDGRDGSSSPAGRCSGDARLGGRVGSCRKTDAWPRERLREESCSCTFASHACLTCAPERESSHPKDLHSAPHLGVFHTARHRIRDF
jgi:hypothetical protein